MATAAHSRSNSSTTDSQTAKLSTAAKKTLQRRVRITIGLAHRKMAAKALLEAVELFEEAEKSCLELGKDGEEMLGEVHHNLAFCHESLGDRTLCKVSRVLLCVKQWFQISPGCFKHVTIILLFHFQCALCGRFI